MVFVTDKGNTVDKKHLITKFFAFGIILLFLGTCMHPTSPKDIQKTRLPPRGNWLYVGGSGPGNYTGIQEAINHAIDGDTVFVYNGMYYGHVNINKSITLLGEDKNTTIISGYIAYTVSIVSDWVFMSGFTIQNGKQRGEGVRVDSCHNTLHNTIIDTPADEIRISGDYNTLSSNTIICDRIFLSGSGSIFSGNTMTNNYYGIFFLDSWDNVIVQNRFFNCGLFITDTVIGNNIVMDNTVNGKPLVYISDESDEAIDGDVGQILLVNCTNITIQDKEIATTTVGIQLVGCTDCLIEKVMITGSLFGICLNGKQNTITGNTIIQNHDGVVVSGDRNTVSANMVSSNDVGINLQDSTTLNILRDNKITANGYGLLLDYGSDFNTILNNTITHNNDAVYLSSAANIFSGNVIQNNNEAVRVYGDSNIISGNSISNNSGSAISIQQSDFHIVANNAIAENKNAITLSNSINTTLQGNTITHNEQGVLVVGEKTKNTILSNNTITENENGIILRNTDNHLILENSISENEIGLYADISNNNTIEGNSIRRNNQGVCLISSSNNTLSQNNFQRNKRPAVFEDCRNHWSQNYWGRPRVLPKLIFGTRTTQDGKTILLVDIDWHPAFQIQ